MSDDVQPVVIDAFVELADTMATDYQIGELLHFLVDRCAVILRADAAGVLLESPSGELRLAAAVSDEMHAIEEAEMRLGEGPCLDAYRLGEQVIAEDLTGCHDRWPRITPLILEIGMRSAYAFPMRLRGDRIGALNLYRAEPGPFFSGDIRLAQAFADVASIGILQQRKVSVAEQRGEQLQHALTSRVIIEQAKGVVAERHRVDTNEAFRKLRTHARSKGLKLRDVCTRVVAGEAVDLSDS